MERRAIRSWLMDMDGVLVHEEQAILGADRWIARAIRLVVGGARFIATNPDRTRS